MTRGATLFSGGGGVEALLKDRIDFVHAVEYDAQIANVYRQNHGDHVQVARVEDVDYSTWGQLDYLHASPVCKNASQAKTGGIESDTDIQTALAVVRCLDTTQPRVFTLENVWGYRQFEAFKRICQALDRGGYMWHFEHLNSADFGVPQTRRRLILRAVRDSLLPGWPAPEPWVGWYAAIEDLLPDLPDSQFAPWQLERLPAHLGETAMLWNMDQTMRDLTLRKVDQPVPTVDTGMMRRPSSIPQAFIFGNNDPEWGLPYKYDDEPMMSMTTQTGSRARAFLVDCQHTNPSRTEGIERGINIPDIDAPAQTMLASRGPASYKAWLSAGRVVKMTPRALARFQSLPDSFWLPEKASLACTVIGNAVPSLMMRKIVEPLI
jgi:DNA-cytosine methyltransferase